MATELTRHMNRIDLVSRLGFERMLVVLVMVRRLLCVDDHDRWLLLHHHGLLLVLHWLAVCVKLHRLSVCNWLSVSLCRLWIMRLGLVRIHARLHLLHL